MGIAPLILLTGHQQICCRGNTVAPLAQENSMVGTGAKKAAARAAAEKGFYNVTPQRKGAWPPKEGKYTESQRSYHARMYMQIHSVQSASKEGG